MLTDYTFGFESEWQSGVEGLLTGLYDRGLLPDRTLHDYHCRCNFCREEQPYPFRAQRDSSCAGELITKILHPSGFGDYSVDDLCNLIEETAVETDAEPGLSAGVHVHVSHRHLGSDPWGRDGGAFADAYWAFARWEPALAHIAGGRWRDQLRGMNRNNRQSAVAEGLNVLFDNLSRDNQDRELTWPNVDNWRDHQNLEPVEGLLVKHGLLGSAKRQLYFNSLEQCHDRHRSLNTPDHLPTWEFRLWNSTRAAWRLRMYVGMSVALMDPVLHGPMLAADYSDTKPTDFLDLLDWSGYDDTAALVERQLHYTETVEEVPEFTIAA